ncbi:hypothetical protein PoB_002910700 [Plakobranchus ocellatus]|uniref:Uncharacterized protein n=1 Tax=Plakobranchus ocellatus TaxID=259542 RepID=A0AAV4A5S0_9GAST|nr:hypothetical protein PoB_002910700 [Plakobranchus ocellatus]
MRVLWLRNTRLSRSWRGASKIWHRSIHEFRTEGFFDTTSTLTPECKDLSLKWGAVAHLVGQLATIQEVRGSIPSPGQVNFHCSSVSNQH